MVINLLLFI